MALVAGGLVLGSQLVAPPDEVDVRSEEQALGLDEDGGFAVAEDAEGGVEPAATVTTSGASGGSPASGPTTTAGSGYDETARRVARHDQSQAEAAAAAEAERLALEQAEAEAAAAAEAERVAQEQAEAEAEAAAAAAAAEAAEETPEETTPPVTELPPDPGAPAEHPDWVNTGNNVYVPYDLLKIRTCESGNRQDPLTSFNYTAANPSSSARGAYQFIKGTWQSLEASAGYETADAAPPAVQDQGALELYTRSNGPTPWNASKSCWSKL